MEFTNILFKYIIVVFLCPCITLAQLQKAPNVATLLLPCEGEELDNGCMDKSDLIIWEFDWSDVPDAISYHLQVWHEGSTQLLIDQTYLAGSSFTYSDFAYIIEGNRYNWRWRVRANFPAGFGTWSEVRSFYVEPLSADCESIVYIPDANFKAYLVGRTDINTNGDGEIQVSEAEVFSGEINVYKLEVYDLTGIEAFVKLTSLNCTKCKYISHLDVSKNLELKKLDCYANQITELNVSHNLLLEQLDCSSNLIEKLDVSNNVKLSILMCSDNQLKCLDLRNNAVLTKIDCSFNDISQLDVSTNIKLEVLKCTRLSLESLDVCHNLAIVQLDCSENQLKHLNISSNQALTRLSCYDNLLSALDISLNQQLVSVNCSGNFISSLDISSNPLLEWLACFGNDLLELDASKNPMLRVFICHDNKLVNIDLRNGNNGNIPGYDFNFSTTNNPDLSCINVSDVHYATANWTNIDPGVVFSTDCSAPVVPIPDANFKAYLTSHPDININGDGEIQVSEAEAFSGIIDVTRRGIKSLEGIEAFIKLTKLLCGSNSIELLDISNNTKLIELDCRNNRITQLDICSNTNLRILKCQQNSMLSLDVSCNEVIEYLWCYSNSLRTLNVSGCASLIGLYTDYNQLKALDVGENQDLQDLSCAYNEISVLSLPHNGDLHYLWCNNNALTVLDVTQHSSLKELHCQNNALYKLILGEHPLLYSLMCQVNLLTHLYLNDAGALKVLDCGENLITKLNVGNNPLLTTLACPNNALHMLDVRNGSNNYITKFNSLGNPDLGCINVSDVYYAKMNWTSIDPGTEFCDNCNAPVVIIPDKAFLKGLLSNPDININGDERIQVTEAMDYTGEIRVVNASISDLTGIEAFINISGLNCAFNNLSELNTSKNRALKYLNCQFNALDQLELSSNDQLQQLHCSSNLLNYLDVSGCSKLELLVCQDNQLNDLKLYNNLIKGIDCSINRLTNLELCNGNNQNIKDFNALHNPDLGMIQVNDVQYAEQNWTNVDPGVLFVPQCILTGESGLLENRQFKIHPNPFKESIRIEGESLMGVDIQIQNLIGEVIYHQTNVNENMVDINLSHGFIGVYVIQISRDGQVIEMQKVVKAK